MNRKKVRHARWPINALELKVKRYRDALDKYTLASVSRMREFVEWDRIDKQNAKLVKSRRWYLQ